MVSIVADDGNVMTFDCGCKAGNKLTTEGIAFMLDPCTPDASCEVSIFIQQEASQQGKPIRLEARNYHG